MAYLNHKSFGLFFVALFIMVKLFTAVVIHPDDPTTLLVITTGHAFSNTIFLAQGEELNAPVITSDENGFIGERFYYVVVDYLWWVSILMAVFYIFITRRKSP